MTISRYKLSHLKFSLDQTDIEDFLLKTYSDNSQ